MNADKIAQKNNIRKTQAKLVEHSRHMYSNSLEREINDPEKKSYRILEQKQEAFLGSFKSFTNMLSKYALVGTAVKAAIVGGVTAATLGDQSGQRAGNRRGRARMLQLGNRLCQFMVFPQGACRELCPCL